MKIVYVSLQGDIETNTPTVTSGGGYNFVSTTTAKYMASIGHDVLYLCAGSKTRLIHHSKALTSLNVESHTEGELSLPLFTPKNKNRVLKSLEKFGPDIVHAQDISPLGLLTQKWALENNTPFVTTLHAMPSDVLDFGLTEFFPFNPEEFFYKKFKDASSKLIYKEFLAKSARVIALNNAIKSDILKYVPDKQIVIIPNGLDLSRYNNIDIYKGTENNLLFPGILAKRKNQEFLIESLKFLPENVKLFLPGRYFTQKHVDKLTDLANQIAPKRIIFCGHMPNKDMPKFYKNIKLFVSASKKEVQSLAVIEALAAGRPVICLENETTNELINDSVGKLLSKETSAEKFASEVKRFLDMDQKKYIKIAENCRNSTKRFSWEIVSEQLLSLYRDLQRQKTTQTEKRKPFTNLIVYSIISIVLFKSIASIKKWLK